MRERAAQATDRGVHSAQLDLEVGAPDPVQELAAVEHTAGILQQVAQEAELGRREAPLSEFGETHRWLVRASSQLQNT